MMVRDAGFRFSGGGLIDAGFLHEERFENFAGLRGE